MPMWGFSPWKKRADVESNSGPSGTAGAAAGTIRNAADNAASKYKYGVQTLYTPDRDAPSFDIVFVHGLTGSRLSTWTKPNKDSTILWPKQLLSKDIPNARILTVGYDADVVNTWAPASQNRVGEHANDLNNALCDLRDATKTTNRPIIFVAHSLGGIVVKDALLISRSDEKAHIRDIYESTKAVAFLGTPHRGTNLASWASWLGTYANIVKKTNQDIMNLLKPQSEVHDRINQDFHKMLLQAQPQKRPLEIVCFFEELPVKGIGEIVPKDSAVLAGYEFRGIHGNHMDMTKFEDEQDPGYQSVCAVLCRWMREYQESLSSNLNSSSTTTAEEMNGRRSTASPWTNHEMPPPILSINYTGGGNVVQGNNVAGSMHFGR